MSIEDDLIRDEGCRLIPYMDTVGKLTTGIGRCLDTNPLTDEEILKVGHNGRNRGITKEQALYLLANDIKKVDADLDREIPWWRKLNTVRQDVLRNMCFNLGIGGLLTFKNTLRAIEQGNWEVASHNMVTSKWATQVGARAKRLAVQMLQGI